jgi:hypothetical protein
MIASQDLRDGCFRFTVLIIGACLLSAIGCQGSGDRPEAPKETPDKSKSIPRLDAPPAEKRSAATLEISKKFGDGGSKLSRLERQELARKLCTAAEASKDDTTMRYVLLDRATDEAAGSGEVETLLQSLEHLEKGYKGDWLAVRMQKLKVIGPIITWAAQFDKAVAAAYVVVDRSLEGGRFDLAGSMLTMLTEWARLRDDKPLVIRTKKRLVAVSSLIGAHAAYIKALDVLKHNPDNAEAHLMIGRFIAFHQNQWAAGLTHIAKGDDMALKSLALQENKSAGTSEETLALAEGWFAAAKKEPEPIRESLQRHAIKLYNQGVKGKSGTELAAENKRFVGLKLAVASRDMNLLQNWKIANGKWTQAPDGKIRGDGNSRANFKQKLPQDFYIQFRMSVASGMRPRIYFGGTQMFIGSDGPTQHLSAHSTKSYRGVTRKYVNGEEMLIGVRFRGAHFDWYANGERIGRGERAVVPEYVTIGIRGGDNWSRGTTLYWDFKVMAKKLATPDASVEKKTEVTQ